MEEGLSYEGFLEAVHPAYRDFVNSMHELFIENRYKQKLEQAKNGYVVSYSQPKSKRVTVNFVFRKGDLVVRIYGDNTGKYSEFLQTLPDDMINAIKKAPLCKRLINPLDCNSRCPMGYDFTIQSERYQKCRYGSFMFPVNEKSIPYIETFIKNEIAARASV